MPEKVEVYAELKHKTDAAYLIDDGETKDWVPRSQVELEDDISIGESGIFILPEWLAIDKEFI